MGCVYSLLCFGLSSFFRVLFFQDNFEASRKTSSRQHVVIVFVVIAKRGQYRLLADGVSELRPRARTPCFALQGCAGTNWAILTLAICGYLSCSRPVSKDFVHSCRSRPVLPGTSGHVGAVTSKLPDASAGSGQFASDDSSTGASIRPFAFSQKDWHGMQAGWRQLQTTR